MRCSGWSSRATSACSAATLTLAVALVLAAPAAAHLSVDPQKVHTGALVDLLFNAPNEDYADGVDRVTIAPPASFDLDDAEAKAGWSQANSGGSITYQGGPIPKGQFAGFMIRGTAPKRAGSIVFRVTVADRAGKSTTYRIAVGVSGSPNADHGAAHARGGRGRGRGRGGAACAGGHLPRALPLAAADRRDAPAVVLTSRVVLFRQFVDDDLGCASYLIGDPGAGTAVVVDPSLRIEDYLEAAAEAGVTIERVLETHTHADHLSGHGRFALEHGVPVAIHPIAEPAYPFEPLEDGQELRLGSIAVRVLHTPGHRPEHCAFLVAGEKVLTGDSLFVGDAARPDLAIEAREGAEQLFHSLEQLAALGDDVEVYPGHVAGSLCGVNMSSDPSSTVARERETNAALAYREVQEFIIASASLKTPRPPTTERVVELNRGPWVGLPPEPEELADPGDATVLDVRPFAAHAEGHVPGAISVPVDGSSFATKAGFVLLPDERVVLHALEPRRGAARGVLALAHRPARPGGLRARARDAGVAADDRRAGAEAAARHRPAGGRRARGRRARRRLHPRLAQHPLPAAAQGRLRLARPVEARGDGLRERPARRGRRVAAAARRLRRARRRDRRSRQLRRRDGQLPALRLVAVSTG